MPPLTDLGAPGRHHQKRQEDRDGTQACEDTSLPRGSSAQPEPGLGMGGRRVLPLLGALELKGLVASSFVWCPVRYL